MSYNYFLCSDNLKLNDKAQKEILNHYSVKNEYCYKEILDILEKEYPEFIIVAEYNNQFKVKGFNYNYMKQVFKDHDARAEDDKFKSIVATLDKYADKFSGNGYMEGEYNETYKFNY